MKTKPFNLEEALAGARVVTRDGNEVTQLYKFDADEDHCLMGVSSGRIFSWTTDGEYLDTGKEYEKDLFIAVEPQIIYANVFEGKNGLFVAPQYFKDKKTAVINKNNFEGVYSKYIKTIQITDEP